MTARAGAMAEERPDHLGGILARLRLTPVLGHLPRRRVWALFVFLNGFVSIALLAGLAAVSRT
ncbi:MAG TPA: hypothetical protein VHF22_04800, partial [Planctomycetota bacterium]|nr:hypothetical protein [Planctomycetota bacterium]